MIESKHECTCRHRLYQKIVQNNVEDELENLTLSELLYYDHSDHDSQNQHFHHQPQHQEQHLNDIMTGSNTNNNNPSTAGGTSAIARNQFSFVHEGNDSSNNNESFMMLMQNSSFFPRHEQGSQEQHHTGFLNATRHMSTLVRAAEGRLDYEDNRYDDDTLERGPRKNMCRVCVERCVLFLFSYPRLVKGKFLWCKFGNTEMW